MSARLAASPLGRRAGAQLLRLVPMRLVGRLVPREVIGFCYHLASDRPLAHVRHLYPSKTPAQLEADLLYLRRRFRVVSHAEIVEARRTGRPLGPDAVFLSFDDALAECFSVVRPLLLRLGLPCTFFVPTAVLDNRWMMAAHRVSLCLDALRRLAPARAAEVLRDAGHDAGEGMEAVGARLRHGARTAEPASEAGLDRLASLLGVDFDAYLAAERPYLSREQVRTLAADGFTIGAHTRTHPHLGSLADSGRVEDEIVGSCRAVAELVGEERVPFAFPYDADGVDRTCLRELSDREPSVGLLFGVGQLRAEGGLILNRMIADTPPAPGRPRTNLPGHLRAAYAEELSAAALGGV